MSSIRSGVRATISTLAVTAFLAGFVSLAPDHAHADTAAHMSGEHLPGEHTMHVTKTPTCGCCGAWVELARREGYEVEVTDTEDYAGMKAMADVPEPMWSCHTTRIGGYTVEGHVPFAAIAKLMRDKPDITGIAVPGEVFFRAGIDGRTDDGPGWLGRLFGE